MQVQVQDQQQINVKYMAKREEELIEKTAVNIFFEFI